MGLACQEAPGRVFGRVWNRTEPFFRFKPGPLAGYPDPLLTLVLVQVYLENQPEKFPKDERTIVWIGFLIDGYSASRHIQWLQGTLAGTHPKSMTGYGNALKLRFEDKDVIDEAYADLEKVRYEGCICDMFTKIQALNDKARVSGTALKKMILEHLPQKIIEQMHTVDLTGKTDQEIIAIITNAGQTAEKWEAARKNLGLKASLKSYDKKHPKLEKKYEGSKRNRFQDRSVWNRFKDRSEPKKLKWDGSKRKALKVYAKTEGILLMEIEQRKASGECLRLAWPSDMKGSHEVKDWVRPIKLDKGTAHYPKAKKYQKIKIAGTKLFSSEEDSSCSESQSEEEESESKEENLESQEENSESYYFYNEEKEQLEEATQRNWWDSPSDSDY